MADTGVAWHGGDAGDWSDGPNPIRLRFNSPWSPYDVKPLSFRSALRSFLALPFAE
jgi:hypothetical protein